MSVAMIRRIPVLATLIVAAAVTAMIWLGVWQLHRLAWKEALIARYSAASTQTGETEFPHDKAGAEAALYHHSHVDCTRITATKAVSGRNARGQAGWAHIATCEFRWGDGQAAKAGMRTARADIVLGWSPDLPGGDWAGGSAQGMIAPGPRLVADPPLAGLAPNARPDPRDIVNNHFAYAMQWFLFAATALVIYAIALWRRMGATQPE